jgi:hypothetical protein
VNIPRISCLGEEEPESLAEISSDGCLDGDYNLYRMLYATDPEVHSYLVLGLDYC